MPPFGTVSDLKNGEVVKTESAGSRPGAIMGGPVGRGLEPGRQDQLRSNWAGATALLLHGLVCDRSWWTESGYVDDLQRDYRVVNVDLRGHGESDKPHEPTAHRGEVVVSDVLAVADAEGIDRFALWGLSYGGWIGWMTAYSAARASGRADHLGFVGSDAGYLRQEWESAWDVADPTRWDARPPRPDQGRRGRRPSRGSSPLGRKPQCFGADPQALLAIQSRELLGEGLPTLEGFPVPALLIAGELEDEDGEAAVVAGMLPSGESLRLPGLGHGGACAASELALPTARAFLDRWFV